MTECGCISNSITTITNNCYIQAQNLTGYYTDVNTLNIIDGCGKVQEFVSSSFHQSNMTSAVAAGCIVGVLVGAMIVWMCDL